MLHYGDGFRSQMDMINYFQEGTFFSDADYEQRRKLLNVWNLPGFSGMHLANYLLNYGIETRLINFFDSEWDWICDAYTNSDRPPLVGISGTFYLSYSEVSRLSKRLRKFDPDMEIVLGGAFANERIINAGMEGFEKPMRSNKINYVLHGFNSEADLRDLILARKGKKSLDQVKNLAYIEDGKFKEGAYKHTSVQWNNPILNEVDFNWDKLYMPYMNQTIQIRTASGCPFTCSFCSYPETAGGSHLMDLDMVEENLKSALRVPGVSKIIFLDDTFNVPKRRFNDMLRIFMKYDFEWFSFLRVQYVDDEIVRMMRDSGCRGVYLGMESSNDLILKNMNKKATREKFLRGHQYLAKYNIESFAAFIIGFPGETDETILENIKFIEDEGIRFYTLKEFYYMEHTPVHKEREKFGLTGTGSDWKHDTMDYQTAYEKKIEIFRDVKSSTFIEPDLSLWYIAYLYDQDYTVNTIKDATDALNDVMLYQLDNKINDNHPAFNRLKKILKQDVYDHVG